MTLPHDHVTTSREYARSYQHYLSLGASPEEAGRNAYAWTVQQGAALSKHSNQTLLIVGVLASVTLAVCIVGGIILLLPDSSPRTPPAATAPGPSLPPATVPPSPVSVPSPPAAAPDSAKPGSACCPWRPIPAANVTAYLAALDTIDPGLTESRSGTNREERAVSRGENTCLDIKQGKDDATLIKNTAARFNGGDASVDEAKASRILPLIRKHLCPAL